MCDTMYVVDEFDIDHGCVWGDVVDGACNL